ncbi:MAG: hypothetical protein ACFFB3_11895 [Candidatus Hodarchaeota archaeon]
MERIDEFEGPFTAKEFAKADIDLQKARDLLDGFVAAKKIRTRKIGRINIYWKPERRINNSAPTKKGFDDSQELPRLELENKELKLEIKDLQKRIKDTERFESDDSSPWRVICMDMAQILAEMRGVTMKEVLDHFGADISDL